MTNPRTRAITVVVAAVAVVAALLLWLSPSSDPGERSPIRVLAAASLTDALTRAAQDFERLHPGVQVQLSFGSSSTLARQIAEGAPADLFLSANREWMDYVAERGLVDASSRTDVLGNSLVVIGPAGHTGGPTDVTGLSAPEIARIGIGQPESVPAGIYARQALEQLGLWEAVAPRLVPGDDVRVVVAYVERAEVDVGIVYRTDARVTTGVRELFALPEASQPDIRYSFARLSGSAPSAPAAAFLEHLTGPAGRATFEELGFTWREDRL